MQTEVYIDLYVLINTSMNLLSLMITASLLHRKVSRLRSCLAALLGGIYAAAALLFEIEGALGFTLDLLAGGLMCAVAFAGSSLSLFRFLQSALVEVLTSMILGGIMTALYSLLNRLDLPLEVLEGDGLSVWLFLLLSLAAGLLTLRGGRFFGFAGRTKSVTVEVRLFEKELTLRAMVDSGNLLRDPVSGRGVIVVEREILNSVLPPTLAHALKQPSPEAWLCDRRYVRYIRLIPTRTAAGDTLLPSILPTALTVWNGRERFSADYLIAPAPLGESARGFDAVIPAD